ncbi:unnamed protein product [Rangifer tarandus platyrhynchus]|uniref:Uncharacterized protein n=1 Tax=Rangifer tarandus platyrhynchus TaxID=3082113 RepID=A0ABN8XJR6_RANTA|nr:unnamed protein product [Rangifer tarandus platyrhynchus]
MPLSGRGAEEAYAATAAGSFGGEESVTEPYVDVWGDSQLGEAAAAADGYAVTGEYPDYSAAAAAGQVPGKTDQHGRVEGMSVNEYRELQNARVKVVSGDSLRGPPTGASTFRRTRSECGDACPMAHRRVCGTSYTSWRQRRSYFRTGASVRLFDITAYERIRIRRYRLRKTRSAGGAAPITFTHKSPPECSFRVPGSYADGWRYAHELVRRSCENLAKNMYANVCDAYGYVLAGFVTVSSWVLRLRYHAALSELPLRWAVKKYATIGTDTGHPAQMACRRGVRPKLRQLRHLHSAPPALAVDGVALRVLSGSVQPSKRYIEAGARTSKTSSTSQLHGGADHLVTMDYRIHLLRHFFLREVLQVMLSPSHGLRHRCNDGIETTGAAKLSSDRRSYFRPEQANERSGSAAAALENATANHSVGYMTAVLVFAARKLPSRPCCWMLVSATIVKTVPAA